MSALQNQSFTSNAEALRYIAFSADESRYLVIMKNNFAFFIVIYINRR